ncbi:MAG TPA: hypothetical protein VNO81_07110 [Candidatus Nitrosotenuis sp.]|jgi:Tfp pilus assembly protein PilV|nr:hypothetical protein [Candidatus Nitrosotenuis sp.]
MSRRGGGYSLIELLFSLNILAVGLLGILGMFTLASTSVARSRNLLCATHMAVARLEKLKFTEYDQITSAPEEAVPVAVTLNGGQVSQTFYRQVQVIPNTDNTMKHVTVIVSWRDPGYLGTGSAGRQWLRLETYVPRQ